jgi:hypothetical protein
MTDPYGDPADGEFARQPDSDGSPATTQSPPARKRRPGRGGHLAGWLLIVVAAAPAVIGVVQFSHSVDSLARVPLSAGGVVTLSHAGGNEIYYESPQCPAPSQANVTFVPPVVLNISPASPGAAYADLSSVSSRSSYSSGGHCGVSIGTVQITHAGRFRIRDSGSASYGAGSDLAVGAAVSDDVWIGVLLTILLGFAGVCLVIVINLRRFRIRLR